MSEDHFDTITYEHLIL